MQDKIIPIILAADDNYARPLAVLAHSILLNLRPGYFADIKVLETRISEEHKKEIETEVAKFQNGQVQFINMSEKISGFELPPNPAQAAETYWTSEAYYRLFIEDIVHDHDKTIYLDTDMVVDGDISELYETDISGYLLGACRSSWLQWCVSTGHLSNGFSYRDYISNVLKLCDPMSYFSSGMMLLNIKEIKEFELKRKSLELLSKIYATVRFPDQCILNVVCDGRVKVLPFRWNFMSVGEDRREFLDEGWLRQWRPDSRRYYQSGEGDPRIIHYVTSKKPWKFPHCSLGRIWWRYARKCDFYNDIPHPHPPPHPHPCALTFALCASLIASAASCVKIIIAALAPVM